MKHTITLLTLCWLLQLTTSAQLIDFDKCQTDSVTDVEGNVYKAILFNDTWWMAEDLKTKHYNDSSDIEYQATEVISYSQTNNNWDYWTLTPRWCYPNFEESNFEDYGLLYSWTAATSTKLCPTGWSLPDTSDWFNLGRLIVGEGKVEYAQVTRNTPTGGTETVYEAVYVYDLGKYLKTDNGKVLGTNKYGESTWTDGGYWSHTDSISNECNGSGMNILPAGEISSTINGFGTGAFYWTPNYVHSDGSGQGRRYMYFSSTTHRMDVCMDHNANLHSVRFIKEATDISLSSNSISLNDSAASTDTVIITGNEPWTVTTDADWIQLLQSESTGSGNLYITANSANANSESRTDTVWVKMAWAATKTIIVTQAGLIPVMSVLVDSLQMDAVEGSTVVFSISSTTNWTVTSNSTWVIPDLTSGSGNKTITLTAEENNTADIRLAEITVKSTEADTFYVIKVVQAMPEVNGIEVIKNSQNKISVYPNPVDNELFILANTPVKKASIITLSGQTIRIVNNENSIDMKDLNSGIYLIKITTENGVLMHKIIKH